MPFEPYDAALFEALASVEPESFWFRARNRLIVSTLRRHFPEGRSLLEVGCGTGFVLEALREAFPDWRLVGCEVYEAGLQVARARLSGVELLQADARALPWRDELDVVGAFDVLEHVEEDEAVLAEMHAASRQGIILLVPQHPRLWSAMDDVAHHVRRYSRRDLVAKVRTAGFRVEQATSFVSSLLPAMVLSRVARRVSAKSYDPVAELQPGRLNGVFERILDGERRLIERGVSLPAGGSLLIVGRKL
jgi:ubiquinone/menaquinone biosynthesis C-methylase UbiE